MCQIFLSDIVRIVLIKSGPVFTNSRRHDDGTCRTLLSAVPELAGVAAFKRSFTAAAAAAVERVKPSEVQCVWLIAE